MLQGAARDVPGTSHSGRDLKWFFDQWLTRAGHPSLSGSWTYDASSKKLVVELAQAGDVYRLPLDIGVDGRIEKIEMTQRTQRFEISAEKAPASVVLDPNTWTLMESKFGPR